MDYVSILIAIAILGCIGAIFGVILGIASKKFHVETDERVERVRECLGGANCGACGFAGCDAFAAAVVAGEAKPNGCPPGGAAAAERIGEILGVSVEYSEKKVATLLCLGTRAVAKDRYAYEGLSSCRAAAGLAGGPKQCVYSCIGLGDCVTKCSFGAIKISNGIAEIDTQKCGGCGTCVEACPRSAIELLPISANTVVKCRNKDVGRAAVAVCMMACIGCKRCEKECETDAIKVVDGSARIDYTRCTRCGKCAAVCPRKCIEYR